MKLLYLVAIFACPLFVGCNHAPEKSKLAPEKVIRPSRTQENPTIENGTELTVQGTYGKKETYPHATGDSSIANLISGQAASGGPAVAPNNSDTEAHLKEWSLLSTDIMEDLNVGRPIIRTKPIEVERGKIMMNDQDLITSVNNRLVADADTVRVTTQLKCSHGEITIRGAASSPGLIGRAIAIALDTAGVKKVISELRIDPNLPSGLRDDPPKPQHTWKLNP